MKLLISTLFVCGILITANAQDASVYLKGGLNIANVSTTNDGKIDDANALVSFHAGFMADLPIGKIFALQPGLLFTGKGAKLQSGQPGDVAWYKATTNPLYLELPVNAVFKFPLEKESSLYIGAGPYVAVGIAGKRKIEGQLLNSGFKSKENIEFSNDDPATNEEEGAGLGIIKRFDYGLNLTGGFQLDKVLISLNYGLGLAKLQSGSENSDNDKNKHRVLSFSIGFKL